MSDKIQRYSLTEHGSLIEDDNGSWCFASVVDQQDAELERLQALYDREKAAHRISVDEATAEARKAAFIEAAEIAENYSELRDIDWWLNATKKEVSADACVSIAAEIRAKAEEAGRDA